MGKRILCLNGGSSSLKVSVFQTAGNADPLRLLDGEVEEIGRPGSRIWLKPADEKAKPFELRQSIASPVEALEVVFARLEERGQGTPDFIVHRVVHGGPRHFAPERVTPPLLVDLKACIPFAPLHLPGALAELAWVLQRLPQTAQGVCFDTHFHRGLPDVAKRLPLPLSLDDAGVHRFGFHGLSCESVVHRIGAEALGRAVIAHLGSGVSMTAVREGKSQDTTMGLTPTGGLMMGTRTGDLDPGVISYLAELGWSRQAIDHCVNHESGLRGVSDSSADMKTLLERRGRDEKAALAVDMFIHQARKSVAALTAVLGGLDTLVFTGGMGARSADIRAGICAGLGFLGIALDPALNLGSAALVSAPDSGVTVRVVPADEELMMALAAQRLMGQAA